MPRARQYRALVVVAVIVTFSLVPVFRKSNRDHQALPWVDGETGFAKPQKLFAKPQKLQHGTVPAASPGSADNTTTPPRWTRPAEFFPVPTESLIKLPTGKAKAISTIQARFDRETDDARKKREARRDTVRAEARRAWFAYKEFAWGHDELAPVSKGSRDPFCGWAATLVDSLDTLWIMGLGDEFEHALEAVQRIDFTTSSYRDEIPVFESTIRYLGGLLAAFDVSGGAAGGHTVLLDKAVELAEVLMGVFDTPNRMPVLYYNWRPAFTSQPHRAPRYASVAELGTLSMEFTRLAQLTGDNKYYDAVARVTNELESLQDRGTVLGGLFPMTLDASGCNRSAPARTSSSIAGESRAGSRQADKAHGLPADWDCAPQALGSSGGGRATFGMGSSQDSAYEYLPKQYLLLGGLEPKYRTMHEKVTKGIQKYLLFRPMIKDDSREILSSAQVHSRAATGMRPGGMIDWTRLGHGGTRKCAYTWKEKPSGTGRWPSSTSWRHFASRPQKKAGEKRLRGGRRRRLRHKPRR